MKLKFIDIVWRCSVSSVSAPSDKRGAYVALTPPHTGVEALKLLYNCNAEIIETDLKMQLT